LGTLELRRDAEVAVAEELRQKPGRRGLRVLAAAAVGLVGSAFIWLVTPYNNYVIFNSYISDSYLPTAALLVTLVLVLAVNPLLRWLRPGLAFDRSQTAIALAIMLVASVLPGHGMLRGLPYSLADIPRRVSADRRLAEAYKAMDLPPGLFPDRIGYQAETPASDWFVTDLPPGKHVPWSAWAGPLVSWGPFLAAAWLMAMGLSLIVLPQWRRNERLAFPLLTVQEALIDDPAEGGLLAPLFHSKGFWIAALGVLGLYLLAGANTYDPESVPAVPLSWDLQRLFTEEPWYYLPSHIYRARIYFLFVGVAFFMPSRIGFSIWFFVIAYALVRVVWTAYFPPYNEWGIVADQRSGAMVAIALVVLWLGRKHWAKVMGGLLGRGGGEERRRDRRAGRMFLLGCAGMFAWLLWVGVPGGWALFYVGFAFVSSLVIARIVAETGLPFIRIDTGYKTPFVKMAPLSWLGPVTIWFSTVIAILFELGSRVSTAVMGTHALGLDRRAGPRSQGRLALGLVGVLLVGVVFGGAVHLWASYHNRSSIDGREQPLNAWGVGLMRLSDADVKAVRAGQGFQTTYNQPAQVLFGGGLAGVLYGLCMLLPTWPLHPVGLLMVNTFYGNEAWASVLIGWLAKVLVVRYGGARLYRSGRTVFIGLMIGEVLAASFWAADAAVRVGLGLPYRAVPIQPF